MLVFLWSHCRLATDVLLWSKSQEILGFEPSGQLGHARYLLRYGKEMFQFFSILYQVLSLAYLLTIWVMLSVFQPLNLKVQMWICISLSFNHFKVRAKLSKYDGILLKLKWLQVSFLLTPDLFNLYCHKKTTVITTNYEESTDIYLAVHSLGEPGAKVANHHL